MATAKSHNGLNRGVADAEAGESDEIRRDIDRTRTEMDRTIDQLSDRLSPRNLFDDLVDTVRCSIFSSDKSFASSSASTTSGSALGNTRLVSDQVTEVASRAGRTFIEAVRENPVPAALMGAGLAWMLFEDKAERAYRRHRVVSNTRGYTGNRYTDAGTYGGSYVDARTGRPYDESYGAGYADRDFDGEPDVAPPSVMDKAASAASSVKETLGSAAHAVGAAAHTVGNVAGRAVEGIKTVAGTAAHAASVTGRGVRTAGRSVGEYGRVAGSSVRQAGSSARQAGSSVRGYGASAAGTVRGASRSAASSLGEFGQTAAESARLYGRKAGDGVNYGYAVSRERFNDALDNTPLAVGIAALAVGLLAGFALPRTRTEDETLGRSSDRLKEEARRRGQEALDQGKEVVSHVADSALGEVEGAGLTPGSIGEKVAKVAKDALSAATESAKREGLDAATLADKAKQIGQAVKEKGKEELRQAGSSADSDAESSSGSTSNLAGTGTAPSSGTEDFGAGLTGGSVGLGASGSSTSFGSTAGGDMSSVKNDAELKHDVAEGMSASSDPTETSKAKTIGGTGDSCSC